MYVVVYIATYNNYVYVIASKIRPSGFGGAAGGAVGGISFIIIAIIIAVVVIFYVRQLQQKKAQLYGSN